MRPSDKKTGADLDRDIQAVLATPAGRSVFAWVFSECLLNVDAMQVNDGLTAYSLGKQAFGRKLIARLDMIDQRIYPRLLLEAADAEMMKRHAKGPKKTPKAITGDEANEDGDDAAI